MRISVVINNFNYAPFLAESIDSALAQVEPGDELIVVDDGSTDESHTVLQRYESNPQVRIIKQANQGQLQTMLNGLKLATRDLILLLDSDDRYLEGYLSRIRERAKAHPEVDLFFSDAWVEGSEPGQVASIREMLDRMELEPGPTGYSRWVTLYTAEFLGTPTSGLALARPMLDRLLAVSDGFGDRAEVHPRMRRLLRLPEKSHSIRRLSGDGILVRAVSAAGGLKYYEPEAAFHYRIHGTNAYAQIGLIGRLYMRWLRGREISSQLWRALSPHRPHLDEVVEEARNRSRPLHRRRRIRMVLNYSYVALRARGGPLAKAGALLRMPWIIFSGR